jgi:hypothetical protein
MHSRKLCVSICIASLWSGVAAAQTAYLEGHVFNKRSGIPIEGAVVVIYENVTSGPLAVLLAEDVTDGNGFYEASVTTTFPVGVIEVFCRTPRGVVVRGVSSAPLQDDVIRRRDIYLQLPWRVRECLEPEAGDIPALRR